MFRTASTVTLAMIAFAANSVFARLALGGDGIDAAGYSGVRLLAGAITLAILIVGSRRELPVMAAARMPARWITAVALLVYAVAFSYAYRLLGAGTGALILFATVQISMLSWGLIKGDRPGLLALLGMAMALGAFVYLVSPGLVAPSPLGAALMIASGIAWAVYSLLGRGSKQPLVDTGLNFILLVPVAVVLVRRIAGAG